MISNSLWDACVDLQTFLERQNYQFCFIGGIAVQRWGEPRVTSDADVTIVVEFGAEKPVLQTILDRYQPRVADPISFAIQSCALLVENTSRIGIAIALGGLPFEQRMVDWSTLRNAAVANTIRSCSAEDLVV